ncbi:MAG: peptidase Ste24p [Actinoallomurus sp.]|nr:peptidase Ste24p [Actinoallomurus sp.]
MRFNGVRTVVLLAGLSALIVVVGGALGGTSGLLIALVIALVTNGVAYFASDRIALSAMGARPVSEVEQPAMYQTVRELSTAARQPMPRLYVSPTVAPNAFATGRNPRKAAVCCTMGILQILDGRELRAVLAHELSHVYNRDILISSVAGALAAVVTWGANLAWFIPLGNSDDEDGSGVLGALLLLVLGPVAAMIIQLAISRTREFQADASGAQLSGDPLALAAALRKIESGTRRLPLPEDGRLASVGHLMIANPFRGEGVLRLFSTHPPTAERVARLEQMAGYRR